MADKTKLLIVGIKITYSWDTDEQGEEMSDDQILDEYQDSRLSELNATVLASEEIVIAG